jgi:very-short-patch-repair endonuclease
MLRDFETWRDGAWADWTLTERPVRNSIRLYQSLFQHHSAIHAAESVPPELVWGIGIGRWRTGNDVIDMPLLEQLVDIEVEDRGAIAIRPRDLPPSLSLKPYLQVEVPGAANLQNQLKDALAKVLMGDAEFSPFNPSGWEHILATATAQLSASASHITRADLAADGKLQPIRAQLAVTSSWAIYGRPRSAEARSQDIEALRRALADRETPIPRSIKGFAAPEPDKPQDITDPFGLSTTVLVAGGVDNRWTPPAANSTKPAIAKNGEATDAHRARFFPLPFNEEQSAIIDLLDGRENHVVTVTGPPGTGKTHTIANIVSHYMAIGKRALVTARTPEAIAAVREKLPESLRSLVIASVGTDRESAQQLRDAVRELSDEVIGLNVADADARRRQLEAEIVACDAEAQQADQKLAEIARKNLAPLIWNVEERSAMDLVGVVEDSVAMHGWFTDRPGSEPPAQLADTLRRLKQMLPRLAPDIAYAGASLPDPADLPTAADLIAAHDRERAWNTRVVPDYGSAPKMARDTVDADRKAKALLDELEDCAQTIVRLAEHQKRIVARLVCGETADGIGEAAFQQVTSYIAGFRHAGEAAAVRFSLGRTSIQELLVAAERGAAERKPIPVASRIFNPTLKKTVESVTIGGRKPTVAAQWLIAHAACKLHTERARIEAAFAPLHAAQLLPPLPTTGWEIAHYLTQARAEIEEALVLAPRLATARRELKALFPVGLDLDVFSRKLRTKDAIGALRANLPDGYQAPAVLTALDTLAGASDLPLFRTIRELRVRLGTDDIEHQDIVAVRNEFTSEIDRLAALKADLAKLSEDLETLISAGAPEWAARLEANPLDAAGLIPEDWESAWAWGMMKRRVDRIFALGNGDEHRKAKAEALRRRGKLFEELVRARTLLGLHQRMTGPVKRALSAFTQAVARIGKGTGKSAPRFQLAAQEAAKEASSAAPVWIMPEYKIPEQLPPIIGDFDLVILDEASQSDITALAALARGKSILVVGDEEQVSPSNVAIPIQKINALRADCLTGLPNAKLVDENTSIFEIAMRMHPDTHVVLREHFRCVAPIIQFSTQFYANRLIPLRVPKASERFDPPLVDVYIKGAERQGQTNASEAHYIVEEIARVIADPAHKHRDIGVISLIGSEQAHKIERMLIDHPRIGTDAITAHHIICGDARTMQGQERSIVFLSMVAVPGSAHAQTKKADQQRINVAMSRARDRLYLVRSVRLDDLNAADIKAKVLQHLQDPMPEGRSAISSGTSDDLFAKCQSGFEREVLTLLLEANYRVRPQVKAGGFFIDLVIEGAEDRRLAVELDGDANHGPDIWQRDMARQAALERAGWTFWRVFGSQWNAQKAYWWQDLKDTLTRMGIAPIGMGQLDERFTEFRTADSFLADPGVSTEAAAGAQTSPAADQRAPANAVGSEDQPADWASTTRSLSGGAFVTAAAARSSAALAETYLAKLPDTASSADAEDDENGGNDEGNPINGQEPDDVTDGPDLDAAHEQGAWAPAPTSRVARAPTQPGFNVRHDALPAPDPTRFY